MLLNEVRRDGQDAAGAADDVVPALDDAELEPESPPEELAAADFFSPPPDFSLPPAVDDPARESVR